MKRRLLHDRLRSLRRRRPAGEATTKPYFVELVQYDPADSPSPGVGHYAGGKGFAGLAEAEKWGRALVGQRTPEEAWSPCCDWQRQDTPISGVLVVDDKTRGSVVYAEFPGKAERGPESINPT